MSEAVSRRLGLSEKLAPVARLQLMIIGAPKSGTTSLKNYVGQHPRIVTHRQREFRFFVQDRTFQIGYERAFDRYFPEMTGEPAAIVAKNVSLMYSDVGIRRLHEHNEDIQVVLSLRHPIDRAHSEFWYARRRGFEEIETFREAVDRELSGAVEREALRPTAYLLRSRYDTPLERSMRIFGEDRVHVLLYSDLRQRPAEVCRAIVRRLPDLQGDFTADVGTRHNRAALPRSRLLVRLLRRKKSRRLRALRRVLGDRRVEGWKTRLESLNERPFTPPPIEEKVRDGLLEYFRPCNERVARLIGRDLSAWNE